MLLDFWYPLAFAGDLGRRPRRVTALGRQLAVWRTRAGRVSVLSDLCVHRGAALSGGRIDGERLTCPYHGWAYGADGACAFIPAQPGRPVPAKARVDAYPVVERYGLVWAFLGDRGEGSRPPLPEWTEFDEPQWRRVQGTFAWDAGVDRVVEGGLDFAHPAFVHRASFGRMVDPKIEDFAVETSEWTGRAHHPGLGGASWYLPGHTRAEIPVGSSTQLLFMAHLPVDARRTLTFWISLRNYLRSPAADAIVRALDLRVMREDHRVIRDQRPELLPFDLSDELHIRADALQLSYRRRRRELIEAGWATAGEPERVGPVEVIASPPRRDPALSRSWVHRGRSRS